MSEHNDGGPAFPLGGLPGAPTGMSLRDYFAAAALTGMLNSMANVNCHAAALNKARGADILLHEGLAISAYAHADAMLAMRSS